MHDFTFAEGLALEPPRDDGRRCMDEDDMAAAGMELDPRGRWRIAVTATDLARLRRLREAA